jgi:hypothetical integral membrane protein (TIGR02206 family)
MQPPTATEVNWLEDFVPFTTLHVVTVAVLGAAMLASCWMGCLWRGSPRERRLRLTWGWFVAFVALVSNIYYFAPANWDVRDSLPLQLCDLAIIIAAGAMLLDSRYLRTLLYFWGIGLSTQAFVTPTLGYGVGHPKFWLFWIGHTCIVGSAVYDIVVGGYRPRVRDLLHAVGTTLGYLVVMLIVNEGIDRLFPNPDRRSNYGYVGRAEPRNPTIIDKLGPWPQRLVPLGAIVMADYALLWVVWPLARIITGKRDPIQDLRTRCNHCSGELLRGVAPQLCPKCGRSPQPSEQPIETGT